MPGAVVALVAVTDDFVVAIMKNIAIKDTPVLILIFNLVALQASANKYH